MIDLDECCVFVRTGSQSFGKCYVGKRVNKESQYSRREKWTFFFAFLEIPLQNVGDLCADRGVQLMTG